MSNPTVSQIKVGNTTYDIQDPEIRSEYYKHIPNDIFSSEHQNYSLNLNSSNTFTPTETVVLDALLLGTDYDLTPNQDRTHGYLDVGKRANGSIYAAVGLNVKDDLDNSYNGYNTVYFNMGADGTPYINFNPGPEIWRNALGIGSAADAHLSQSYILQNNSQWEDLTPLVKDIELGSDLEVTSAGIICKRKGYVEVSANCNVQPPTTSLSKWTAYLGTSLESTTINTARFREVDWAYSSTAANRGFVLSCSPKICEITNIGDRIKLRGYGTAGVTFWADTTKTSWLTVRYIA